MGVMAASRRRLGGDHEGSITAEVASEQGDKQGVTIYPQLVSFCCAREAGRMGMCRRLFASNYRHARIQILSNSIRL